MASQSHSNSEATTQQLLSGLRERRQATSPKPLVQRHFLPCLSYNQKTEAHHCSEDTTTTANKAFPFRVMQWNMLAQGLCRCTDGFVLCPDQALDWSYRQLLIMEEILTYSADIVCLQEVDVFDFLEQQLAPFGYRGTFFPKPDSPCLYTKESKGPDGCAMFWKEDRLCLVEEVNNVVLKRLNGTLSNQVAVICKFKPKTSAEDVTSENKLVSLPQREFYVCTTHLKSKPPFKKVRYEQGQYLETFLSDLCGKDLALIVCGDFNAEPCEKVIEVFKTSSLNLTSSYCDLDEDMSEPRFTTWKVRGNFFGKKDEVSHTIDYLFYTAQHLACKEILQIPSEEEIGESRLPSYSYPSDHISLVADFELRVKAPTTV